MRYQTMFWYNTQVKRTQRVLTQELFLCFSWEKEEIKHLIQKNRTVLEAMFGKCVKRRRKK